LQEFFRIRDASNDLTPEDPYVSWPDKLPEDNKIYTCFPASACQWISI
jgi:hypothetical protein